MTDPDLATSRRVLLSSALGLGGLAALSAAGPASAAPIPVESNSDFYLDIAGVEGESTDEVHSKEIELLTWSFGVSTAADPLASGGAGAGRSKPTDFAFVARTSKASPKLYQLVCTGKHLKSAVLSVVRNGEARDDYLKVTLKDAIITSYQVAPGENDGYPLDVVKVSYAAIVYAYRYQLPTGQLSDWVTFGFDFAENRPIQSQ